jgi:KipI family sensor histidine kinase inhibitor
MTRSVPVGEVRRLGDRAFLIGVADAPAARALAGALEAELARSGAGEVEMVCGSATVAVLVTGDDAELEAVEADVQRVAARAPAPGAGAAAPAGRLVVIPCAFDGPDLGEVAARAGCTQERVVAELTAQPLRVTVVGFSPGFAYLGGLPEALRRVPRRARPRPVVPAGSVAVANGHAAVYPTASPGGWQLVGRTGFPLFSTRRPPYAVLAPGGRVRFTLAGAGDPVEPPPLPVPEWSPPAGSRPVLEIVTPPLRAVVQDGGRRGVAAAGVPGAGPADPPSFVLANRLVGNPDPAGALELLGGGTRLRSRGPCHVAVVGAAPDVRVDGAAVPGGRVLPLAAGQLLEVGPLRRGCRTYLSVAGGVLGPEVFGSRASDELCGLGPGPLVAGEELYAGPWAAPLGDHLGAGAATEVDAGADAPPLALRVVPGPHPEHFATDALARLARPVFRVEGDSNRVGLRLRAEGEAPELRSPALGAGELDSQGVVTGAVQVPPGGDPVVLMPDHATLGGYPVLAVVASADHGVLGQCAPGTRVRLVPIDHDEAAAARRARRRALDAAVVGHYPLSAG